MAGGKGTPGSKVSNAEVRKISSGQNGMHRALLPFLGNVDVEDPPVGFKWGETSDWHGKIALFRGRKDRRFERGLLM